MKKLLPKKEDQNESSPAAGNTPVVQPKLKIGKSGDESEQQAESIANNVNRGDSFVQRKCDHCEEEEKQVQRKESSDSIVSPVQAKDGEGSVNSSLGNKINSSKGNGTAMDSQTRSFMQSKFDADFNDVKIHTDGEAVQMNRELHAKAFTTGNDIYFNQGQYQPNSTRGRHLLAHELTHVLQQKQSTNGELIQRIEDDAWYLDPDYDPYKLAPIYCPPGEVNDDKVQQYIDEALEWSAFGGAEPNTDMAHAHLFQEREKHCCDYDYAAAEHYMWARREVGGGWPAWLMIVFIYSYRYFKAVVPKAGECNKTAPNTDVRRWGMKGVSDGLKDRKP